MTQPCDICDKGLDAIGTTECKTISFCIECSDDSEQLEKEEVRGNVYYYLRD